MCQLRIVLFEKETNSFFPVYEQWIYIFEEVQKQTRGCTSQSTLVLLSTTVKSAKPAVTCLVFALGTKSDNNIHLVEMVHIASLKKEKPSQF